MTHIYLIRHADSIEGLKEDGKYGDLGLSPEGIASAEKLRNRLARTGELKPDVFIASSERRAHETAQIIAPALNQTLILDDDFVEWRCDDGTLEPEEFMACWERVPDAQKPYFRWQEGDYFENLLEFGLRVNLTLNRVIQEHTGKNIVIVSHGAFIQSSFNFFFGYGQAIMDRVVPEIRRTSITHWFKPVDKQRWVLERSNDYYHLLES